MIRNWHAKCRARSRSWTVESLATTTSAAATGQAIDRSRQVRSSGGTMSVIWQKVWFDLWNNKVRAILAVISIAVGVFAVGTIFGMNDQMLTSMDSSHKKDMAQHFTMNLTVAIDREIALALRKVPGVEDVEPFNNIGIRYRLPNDENWHQGVVMMRDDYRNQKYQLLQLKAGEWPKGGELGMEYMQADYYHLQLGDRVIVENNKKELSMAITSKIRHP